MYEYIYIYIYIYTQPVSLILVSKCVIVIIIFMGKFERNFIYPCLQTFQNFIFDLLMISFYSGMEAKHNY